MIVTAEQKYTRQTPTRLRLVAKAIRKLSVTDAMDQLRFINMRSARTMLDVMKQAVANATNTRNIPFDLLVIKDIVVNEGPQFKRIQPVSRGRAHAILKRTAHVRVVLESREPAVEEKSKDLQDEKAKKHDTIAVSPLKEKTDKTTMSVTKKPAVKKSVSKTSQQKTDKKVGK
ncbi:MAG: 50S ribosomal protein L22 [Microgenomates group bacterium GW2011_GWF2_45_18]|nr:MAG: 50S ribosomal protein L22 [Microgenomates group bacterium GW2011_GWF1_44_10]KKU01972.1 MAG: 50S ribosomal protein L22 [Microgenomates group bacterium GW2011_GWF2_45_18]OGJ41014.1 MAG: 50S ribosomal protein L22 [Candidatus Pacebacteria bacterium RIFOXYB1_FULL_44_10]HAU99043.1 50S ribosomal protein L22 [Candidatus Paceibacterota bacterium]HAX01242.1 50S ribosomal protein L22 [Candidatus Paceibacterota bacterium]